MAADASVGGRMTTVEPPVWELRFRAPQVTFPRWARDAPDRLVFASNVSGTWQLWALDRATGARRQVTDHPVGVQHGVLSPDGARVVWFHDERGDERGRWVWVPFTEPGREPQPLVGDLGEAWDAGLAIGERVTVLGSASEAGYAIHAVHDADGRPELLYTHTEDVTVQGLSRDGGRVCLAHSEHGDSIHRALRVLDARTGAVVGEQWDGPGRGLEAARWSPVPDDLRLAIVHEREGRVRPGVWDLARGEREDLAIDLPGDVTVADWWPDAAALLLVHDHHGRTSLHRLALDSGELTELAPPEGTIERARVRPDGEVWMRWASGAQPPVVRDGRGDEVLAADGARAPRGRPYRSWWFANPRGQRVHGFVSTPPGDGPFPLVMQVHGGPTMAYTDTFMPDVQAWVDAGFAVAMVNYRGSTGYGTEWRDALIGNPGFLECEDVLAGLDDLVASGLADRDRAVLLGRSWGGYITLLGLGRQPDRWAVGVAVVPVADYPTAYADEAPQLQAYDRTLFGGSPDERPELYRERSPLTYVECVRAPVLIIAGANDSRCPIRQIVNYVEARRAAGGEVEFHTYETGHGSMVVEERVQHMRWELEFVQARVPAGRRA
jgi:dipeptidyl aminopeptidase/acylaminoacyl peptidase